MPWNNSLPKQTFSNIGFEWPESLIACLLSIVTTFNRNPGPSRAYTTSDKITGERIDRFEAQSKDYYIYLNEVTKSVLVDMLKRKVRSRGNNVIIRNYQYSCFYYYHFKTNM